MINKTRSLSVLGGVVLATAALTLLSLAGVGSDRRPPRAIGPDPVTVREPRTANQPELSDVLLTARDIPGGYPASAAPRPSPTGVRTECRTIFESLVPLAAGGRPARRGESVVSRAGATLRQVVTVYPARGASDAYGGLRRAAIACPRFTATLEEGTPVTVEMTDVTVPEGRRDAFTVGLSVRGERGQLAGYLAVGRRGGAVSVLRELGPPGTVRREDAVDVLRVALDRLSPLVRTGG